MKFSKRIEKIERKIIPSKKEPITITIHTLDDIDFDLLRKEYNDKNGTNYSYSEWIEMDIIVSRIFCEGDADNWKFETVTSTGETVETIYKKYPKEYQQYKINVRRAEELIKSMRKL
jgi:hypothetical protein